MDVSEQKYKVRLPDYQLTSLSCSFRERKAVLFAADLSTLVSRGGVRFSVASAVSIFLFF